jgi:hypothetical protein
MQGRDALSVHRSMQRWLSLVLPADWDVQPTRKEPQFRPLAVVRPINATPSSGTAYVREYDQPYEIFLYPLPIEGEPWASEQIARSFMTAVLRALDSGYAPAASKALRIPLYDYTGVPADQALPVAAPILDYLVVRLPSAQVQQDTEQDDLYTVVMDLRVNWRDDGDTTRFVGTPLTTLPLGWRAP